ncbi:MAG TPA: hypothetical protein VGL88_05270 [Pseudonocardiaceae bacterium]|jgi:hypothetical protein
MSAPPEQPPAERNRRVIHATCTKHGGSRGFANLVMSRQGAVIVLDPHVAGQCVLQLDEAEATVMRDALTEWLG